MGQTRELQDPLVGSLVAERYRILKRLAAGGMGVVYEATQEPLGRRVALKVIRGDSVDDPVAQLRFEREAKTVSSIQDPHVVVVYDFGSLQTTAGLAGLFLAMEFVEGETLRAHLAHGRVTWRKSLVIIEHIARALSAAHTKGLVHRDLKPENVMLTTTAGSASGDIEFFCKVLDFGLAKGIHEGLLHKNDDGQRLTRSGGFVGTPGYISPEHIDGANEDPRQDVYALGIVWWEMLTSRHPFPAETPMKTLLRQMHEEPPPLDDVLRLSDDIPPAGADLVRAMMAKNPKDRPRDGAAVLDRLLVLSQGMSTRFERVDVNAATMAGRRFDVDTAGHIDDIPRIVRHSDADQAPVPSAAREVATVDHRAKVHQQSPAPLSRPQSAASASAPTSPTPPAQSSAPSAAPTMTSEATSTAPLVVAAPRSHLALGATAGLILVGGALVASRYLFPAEPPPPPPPRVVVPVVVDAGAPMTEVIIEGMASFAAMKTLRGMLPPHELRVYRPGRTELSFDGDVAAGVADRLDGKSVEAGGAVTTLEVKELDRGRVVVRVVTGAPAADAGVVEQDKVPAPTPGPPSE